MSFEPRYFLFVLPLLLVIAVAEAVLYRWLGKRPFAWGEAGISLGIIAGQFLKTLITRGLVAGIYLWLWQFRLFTVPLDQWWGIALLAIGFEFFYYWEHRLSHEIRWFWATHVVHHTPSHLNFLAALRLGWTAELSGLALFFTPLVILGFHPLAVLAALFVNLIYQFWLHSEWFPRLGVLEYVLNTPSNHRVHHAANPEYLDRNFGGMIILFDRLFGTYVAERDDIKPRYGLVTPLKTRNPIKIALHEWAALLSDVAHARNWREAWMYMFGAPGWRPDGSGMTSESLRRSLDQATQPDVQTSKPYNSPATPLRTGAAK